MSRCLALAFCMMMLSCVAPASEIPEGLAILGGGSARLDASFIIPPTPPLEAVRWSADDDVRGFVVTVMDTAIDATAPRGHSAPAPTLEQRMLLARDEYRAVSLLLATRTPQRAIRAVFSDFIGPGGAVIPAKHFDLRRVVKSYQGPVRVQDGWKKQPAPNGEHLLRADLNDVPATASVWLWATLHAPVDAAPGRYAGTLNFEGASGTPAAVRFELVVPDFALPELEDSAGFSIQSFYHDPDPGKRFHNFAWPQWTRENAPAFFRFWKTRRLSSPILYDVFDEITMVDGRPICDFGNIRGIALAMREAGLRGYLGVDVRIMGEWAEAAGRRIDELEVEGKDWRRGDLGVKESDYRAWLGKEYKTYQTPRAAALFCELLEKLLKTAEAEAWPPLLILPEEEMDHEGRKADSYDFYAPLVNRVAPGRLLVVDNDLGWGRDEGAIDRGRRDGARFRSYNSWTDVLLADARADDAEVWIFNHGTSRAAYGLLQAKLGSRGCHQWAEWHYRNYNHVNAILADDGGVISSMAYERIRDGRNDLAYVRLLESLIDELRRVGHNTEADGAATELRELLADIPYTGPSFRAYLPRLRNRDLDVKVALIARRIVAARQRLGLSTFAWPGQWDARDKVAAPAASSIVAEASTPRADADRTVVVRRVEGLVVDGLREALWQRQPDMRFQKMGGELSRIAAMAGNDENYRRLAALESYSNLKLAFNNDGLVALYACNHVSGERAARECKKSDGDANLYQDPCLSLFFLPPGERHYRQLLVNGAGARAMLHAGRITRADEVLVRATGDKSLMQEIFIPWSVFGRSGPPKNREVWRANFGREHLARQWVYTWAPVDKRFNEIEAWGSLIFDYGGDSGTLVDIDMGEMRPGRNTLVGTRRPAEAGGEPGTVELRDGGRVLARHKLKDPSETFRLVYELAPGTNASLELRLLHADGKVLDSHAVAATVPEPLGDIDASVRAFRHAVMPLRITLPIAAASLNEVELALSATGPGGTVVFPSVRPARADGNELHLDTASMAAGQWTLHLQALRDGKRWGAARECALRIVEL